MIYENMCLYKQNQLNSLNHNSVLLREYVKQKDNQAHLIRIYKKFEKINRTETEVFYFIICVGTEFILNNVVGFERTQDKNRINQIIKHIESLR